MLTEKSLYIYTESMPVYMDWVPTKFDVPTKIAKFLDFQGSPLWAKLCIRDILPKKLKKCGVSSKLILSTGAGVVSDFPLQLTNQK